MTNYEWTCENCKFWEQTKSDKFFEGKCRRHAAKPKWEIECDPTKRWVHWPVTEGTDFCGEFEMKIL